MSEIVLIIAFSIMLGIPTYFIIDKIKEYRRFNSITEHEKLKEFHRINIKEYNESSLD